jgi:hypothetical protein
VQTKESSRSVEIQRGEEEKRPRCADYEKRVGHGSIRAQHPRYDPTCEISRGTHEESAEQEPPITEVEALSGDHHVPDGVAAT